MDFFTSLLRLRVTFRILTDGSLLAICQVWGGREKNISSSRMNISKHSLRASTFLAPTAICYDGLQSSPRPVLSLLESSFLFARFPFLNSVCVVACHIRDLRLIIHLKQRGHRSKHKRQISKLKIKMLLLIVLIVNNNIIRQMTATIFFANVFPNLPIASKSVAARRQVEHVG